MSVHAHRKHAPRSVRVAVLTVSDTRTEESDTSGGRIRALLAEAGHEVVSYAIVADEPDLIRSRLGALPAAAQVAIVNGGTGLARRDTTFEAVGALFDKTIDGFGELFRMLSWEEIGAAAMLSRATAGVAGGRVIFSIPGSTAAVELAMTRLILPELGHVVGLLGEPSGDGA
jgi:molybdenum cofactor biosynthesis protein B